MRYRTLGNTGIQVTPYCLGAMMFGQWGNPDHDESIRIIHKALDAGINFIDTADVYSRGESEQIVGKALAGRRDSVVLATKVHGTMGDDPNQRGNSRRWIRHEVEASLRRLETDYIDLYQIHRPDPTTDIEETLSVLTDLVREGKVRAIGSSTFPPEYIVEARWAAERRGFEHFACEQPPYSILFRGIEAGVLPVVEQYRMGAIVWSPLAGGWLSGRIRKGKEIDQSTGRALRQPSRYDLSLPDNQRKLEAVEALIPIADDLGVPLSHMAIAFTIAHPGVTSAIIGPRTMEQLDDLLAGTDLVLGDDVLDRIDQVVPPGTSLSSEGAGWLPLAVHEAWRRRRPMRERAAGERAAG
jgi:aryl-alcohol dehydrogenase (NADP+)